MTIETALTDLLAFLEQGALPASGAIPAVAGDGTIAAGGTAQAMFASVVPVNGYWIANPDASEDLWISDSGTAAANAVGSLCIPPRQVYETPIGYKPPGTAISIVAATTGHKFTARRY